MTMLMLVTYAATALGPVLIQSLYTYDVVDAIGRVLTAILLPYFKDEVTKPVI